MMDLDDAGQSLRFLLRDHDRKFSRDFDTVVTAAGCRIVLTPVQGDCCIKRTHVILTEGSSVERA
jgi:hypothetical protein